MLLETVFNQILTPLMGTQLNNAIYSEVAHICSRLADNIETKSQMNRALNLSIPYVALTILARTY